MAVGRGLAESWTGFALASVLSVLMFAGHKAAIHAGIPGFMYPYAEGALIVHLFFLSVFLTVLVGFFSRTSRVSRSCLTASFALALFGEGLLLGGSQTAGFFALLFSIILSAVSVVWLRKSHQFRCIPLINWTRFTKKAAIWILFATAVFLRLYKYEGCLDGLAHDEAVKAGYAVSILDNSLSYKPFIHYKESPYYYFSAICMRYFGETPSGLRLTATVFAIGTLIVFFIFFKSLLGWEVAVTATWFLAFSLWHTSISRIAQRLVMVPLFQMLTLVLIYRIWVKPSWWRFGLLGAVVAGGFYTYPPIRFFYAIFFPVFVFALISRRSWCFQQMKKMVLFLAVFTICFLFPLGSDIGNVKKHFLDSRALGYRSVPFTRDLDQYKSNMKIIISTWHLKTASQGTIRPVNTGKSLLEPIIAVFFTVGLGITIGNSDRFPYFLLLMAFLCGLIPGFLFYPFQRRLICATLMTFPLAALAFRFLLEQVHQLFRQHCCGRQFIAGMGMASLLLTASLDGSILAERFYRYNEYYPLSSVYETSIELVRRGYRVMMIGGRFYRIRFMYPSYDRFSGIRIPSGTEDICFINAEHHIPFKGPVTKNLAYIIYNSPLLPRWHRTITQMYPHAIIETYSYRKRPIFSVYLVSQQEAKQVAGQENE